MRGTRVLPAIIATLCLYHPAVLPESHAVAIIGSKGEVQAAFNEPRDIEYDAQGKLYVADFRNNRVQVFDPEGNFLLSWGSPGTAHGQFKDLTGLAVSANGVISVADTWNHRIQQFAPEGGFLRELTPNLFAPKDVAVRADGNLVVSDTGNGRIVLVSQEGRELQTLGGRGSGPGQFSEACGVCLDQAGRVYVVDVGNHRLQLLTADLHFVREIPLGQKTAENSDSFCQVLADGSVWVSYPAKNEVLMLDANGEIKRRWGKLGSASGSFDMPAGVAVQGELGSPEFRVAVADRWNHRVQIFAEADLSGTSSVASPKKVVGNARNIVIMEEPMRVHGKRFFPQPERVENPRLLQPEVPKGVLSLAMQFVLLLAAAFLVGGYLASRTVK